MERSTGRYGIGLAAVAALAVILVATPAAVTSGAGDRTLVVADADSGDRLLETSVDEGDEVTLSYTHSVEKTPVADVYVVGGTELREDRIVFHSHGAGLPSDDSIERTDEGFVVERSDSHERLTVAPSPIAGHELVVDGERYDLVDRSDGSVVLYVDDGSLTDLLSAATPVDGPNRGTVYATLLI